jgi:SHS2 domain-containing protein
MEFTERELALIMVALDSAENTLRAHPARSAQTMLEAKDMQRLWSRVMEQRLHITNTREEERS